jgi:translation initiation factor IF-3
MEDISLFKGSNNQRKNNRVFVNNSIRALKVRCIDQNDENIGVILKSQAMSMAEAANLDLVQVSEGETPTCKIVDYGKYKYELTKKERLQAKKQRESAIKTKEIKFRPTTELHDLQTKARLAGQFIADGCRVKVAVCFKGRELQHKHLAPAKLDLFVELIGVEVSTFEDIKVDGKMMSIVLAPKGSAKAAKAS